MNLFSRFFGSSIENLGAIQVHGRLAQQPKPLLLDVRQPEEYRSGHIHGAKLIPLNQLMQHQKELPRERPIICVCHSGNRSRTATRQLVAAGFSAANLKGGMNAWKRAGLPIKKGMSK
jgi:rhodanese-related sulfurtransferase